MKKIRWQQSYCTSAAWKPPGEFHTFALCFKLAPTTLKKTPKTPKQNKKTQTYKSLSLLQTGLLEDSPHEKSPLFIFELSASP